MSINIYAQNTDDLIVLNNDTIKCSIEKIEKNKIYYKKDNKQLEIKLDQVVDINLKTVLKTKKVFELQKPKEGKALVYIYRPHEIVNMLVNLNISSEGKKIVKLKNNSCFIHEVNPGTIEYKGDFWIGGKLTPTKLEAKEGEIYFLQVDQTGRIFNGPPTPYGTNTSVDFFIFERKKNIAEIILSYIKNYLIK